VTLGDLLTRLAGALPRHDALVYIDGPRFTFASLEAEARTIARDIRGLVQGDKDAVMAARQ